MRLWVNTIAVYSYISVTLFFFFFFFAIVWVLWCYLIPWSLLWVTWNHFKPDLRVFENKQTVLCCLFGLVLLHSYLGHLAGLDILVGSVYHWTICLFYPNQAGRLLLRRVVCEKIGVPWSEIRLERSPRGKPYLASPIKVSIHSCYHSILQSLLLYLNYIDLS